jgi:hypothetical protein
VSLVSAVVLLNYEQIGRVSEMRFREGGGVPTGVQKMANLKICWQARIGILLDELFGLFL